jgi:hypothetical protein
MRPLRAHTTQARDAALKRLSRANRLLIAGSVVLTGVLSDVAANAFAGKTIGASAVKHTGGRARGSSARKASPPLTPPAEAPRSSEPAPPQRSEAPEPTQSAPAQESPPPEPQQQESPAPAAPAHEPAPAQEEAPPAVSGGS